MIWIEMVCDGCQSPCGESYRKGSLKRIKAEAKGYGWKTIKGKMYCPRCQKNFKSNGKSEKDEVD